MSIDWTSKKWKYISDSLYLGNKKINEIWLGGKKIYPSLQPVDGQISQVVILDGNVYANFMIPDWQHYPDILLIKDGERWNKIMDMPPRLAQGMGSYGQMIAYNGEIHLVGCNNATSSQDFHYVLRDKKWRSLQSLKHATPNPHAVVHDSYLHILGAGKPPRDVYHDIYSDSGSIATYSNYYAKFFNPIPVDYNGDLYIVTTIDSTGHTTEETLLQRWDGESTWTTVATIPGNPKHEEVGDHNGVYSMFVYNGVLNVIARYENNTPYYHFTWDGSSWDTLFTDLPIRDSNGVQIPWGRNKIVYDGVVHMFYTNHITYQPYRHKHYIYDGNVWAEQSDMTVYG